MPRMTGPWAVAYYEELHQWLSYYRQLERCDCPLCKPQQ